MALLTRGKLNGPPISAPAVELMPGDVALAQRGDQLRTLLGSCVSVILTDSRRTVAAMNHIVHVGAPNAINRRNTAFGQPSMADMYAKLRSVGITPTMCQAYVYGGGNMFPHLKQERHVGSNNAHWVLDFLENEGIHIIDHSLGGSGYRKVSWTVGQQDPVVETVLAGAEAAHVR